MLCLEFSVNGEAKHVAGHRDADCVNAQVLLCPKINDTQLTVFGDVVPDNAPVADARWFNQKLKVGDVVTVRLVETNAPESADLSRSDPSVEANDGIPMVCSFCGKNHMQIERMMAGKTALICNECIDFMHSTKEDRIAEQMLDSSDDA